MPIFMKYGQIVVEFYQFFDFFSFFSIEILIQTSKLCDFGEVQIIIKIEPLGIDSWLSLLWIQERMDFQVRGGENLGQKIWNPTYSFKSQIIDLVTSLRFAGEILSVSV